MTKYTGPNAFRSNPPKPDTRTPKILAPYNPSPTGVVRVAKGPVFDNKFPKSRYPRGGGQSGLVPVLEVAVISTPTPIGVIDLENGTYSWGATSKVRSDLFGTAGPWTFSAPNLVVDSGYEGEAYAALLNEALAAMVAGTVLVFDTTVPSSYCGFELYDAPGFNTDLNGRRGDTSSTIFDGNGGGSATTANGGVGRAKTAWSITSLAQSVCQDGGAVADCTPPVAYPNTPTITGITVSAGCVLHSIKFYDLGTDLAAVTV